MANVHSRMDFLYRDDDRNWSMAVDPAECHPIIEGFD